MPALTLVPPLPDAPPCPQQWCASHTTDKNGAVMHEGHRDEPIADGLHAFLTRTDLPGVLGEVRVRLLGRGIDECISVDAARRFAERSVTLVVMSFDLPAELRACEVAS